MKKKKIKKCYRNYFRYNMSYFYIIKKKYEYNKMYKIFDTRIYKNKR